MPPSNTGRNPAGKIEHVSGRRALACKVVINHA
jgi:hypothetical protein